MKKLLTFLIFIIITIGLVNGGWLLWKERFDLPKETKELIVGTIKNELSLNANCVKESCRKEVRNLENVLDEISYANQLGRLDTISLILALFGLILGFGAIYGFMNIKEDAHRTAEHEAKEFLKKNGRQLIKEVLASGADNAAAMMLSAKKVAREEKNAGREYEELENEQFENE